MSEVVVQQRDNGKRAAKLRKEGFVPCAFSKYDNKTFVGKLSLGEAEGLLAKNTTRTVLDVELGGKSAKGIIREIQKDPVTREVLHITFMEVQQGRPLRLKVPIKLKGVAPVVKDNLGILLQPTKTLLVRCKPEDIPEYLEVDVTVLGKVGTFIKVRDIDLPEGVELVHSSDLSLSLVSAIGYQKLIREEEKREEEMKEQEEAAAAEAAEAEGEEGEGEGEAEEGAEGETPEGEEAAEGEEKPEEGGGKKEE